MSGLLERLEELARDVGRLRRRAEPDSSLAHLADRMAGNVESLDCMLHLSAGELVAAGEPVDRALRLVDWRARQVRTLLGESPR